MKIAFSWDDGAIEDVKLFELHEKYEVPGIFFIPTRNREGRKVISPQLMRKYESGIIEFGGHTDNHAYLTDIPSEEVECEIKNNQDYLEDALGHHVEHFCFPGGKYNRGILDVVFQYYKTARTADTMNFLGGDSLYKPTFHFYPRGNKSLAVNAVRQGSYSALKYVLQNHKKDYFMLIAGLVKKMECNPESRIMIWGHSWEIEELQLWDKLEELMVFLKDYGCNRYSDMFEGDLII